MAGKKTTIKMTRGEIVDALCEYLGIYHDGVVTARFRISAKASTGGDVRDLPASKHDVTGMTLTVEEDDG